MCHKIKTMEIDENTKIKYTKFTFYYIQNILLFTSSTCPLKFSCCYFTFH